MKMIRWCCEVCGKDGRITCSDDERVISVLKKIQSKHKKISPSCENPITKRMVIKLSFPGKLTESNKELIEEGGILSKFKKIIRG